MLNITYSHDSTISFDNFFYLSSLFVRILLLIQIKSLSKPLHNFYIKFLKLDGVYMFPSSGQMSELIKQCIIIGYYIKDMFQVLIKRKLAILFTLVRNPSVSSTNTSNENRVKQKMCEFLLNTDQIKSKVIEQTDAQQFIMTYSYQALISK
jgi:hypothetical protein